MCLTYVETLVDQSRVKTGLGPAEDFSKALKTAAMVLDLESGGSTVIGWDIDGQLLEQKNFLASLRQEAEELGVLGAQASQKLAQLLDLVPLRAISDLTMMQILAAAVGQMHFWGQEPSGEEQLATHPQLRRSMLRVAEHIVASEATAWWYEQWNAQDQWVVRVSSAWHDQTAQDGPLRTLAEHESLSILVRDAFETIEAEREARRNRYADPTQKLNGMWWSFPPYQLEKSTSRILGIGPVGVYCEEDGRGEASKVAWRVLPLGKAIFEIKCAEDWAMLCALYPNDVSATRLDMWEFNTGRRGRWVIPDWLAMANDYDGVHLTAAAYIALAGAVIPVPELDFSGDWASSIAGWTPDWTFYFAPVVADQDSHQRWVIEEAENELEVWEPVPIYPNARAENENF